MRKILENFYQDYSKEHASFYSLLNKINNDMKTNPEIKNRVEQIKSGHFYDQQLQRTLT